MFSKEGACRLLVSYKNVDIVRDKGSQKKFISTRQKMGCQPEQGQSLQCQLFFEKGFGRSGKRSLRSGFRCSGELMVDRDRQHGKLHEGRPFSAGGACHPLELASLCGLGDTRCVIPQVPACFCISCPKYTSAREVKRKIVFKIRSNRELVYLKKSNEGAALT